MFRKSKVLQSCYSLLKQSRASDQQGYLSNLQRSNQIHSKTSNSYANRHLHKNSSDLRYCNSMSVQNYSVMGSDNQVELTVSPNQFLLVDDELQIQIKGLDRGQIITLHAVTDEEKKVYESCCSFEADENGVVNVSTQPSRSGTYTGVSPMGIFWSMVPAPGQRKGVRLMKNNIETPFKTTMYTYDGEMSLEDLHVTKLSPLNVSEIERWYLGEGVTTQMVKEGNVRGKLFLPEGPGPFPGVIDLFGTVGGITEHRAALLASRGFATLALPYFLYDDLPKGLADLSLDYFLEAIDWMLGHKQVYSEQLGVIGTSKGGDLALLMGAYSPKVSAIVNINGCTFCATFPLKYSGGDIPGIELQIHKFKIEDDAYIMKDALEFEEKDLIPVWKYNPKILNILSEDDLCSPKECIRLLKQCYPPEQTDNCTVLAYDKAGHLMEPPYTPLCRMSYHKSFGMYFLWGGYPEEHAAAQEHAWRNILDFLHKNIPQRNSINRKTQSNL